MARMGHKQGLLRRRKQRVRKKITGTSDCPRLTVYRSLNHIYAQLIDDVSGRTLAQASSLAMGIDGGTVDAAKKVGKQLADTAKAQSIGQVAFDRNGRRYHGRVRALAEAAREGGLKL